MYAKNKKLKKFLCLSAAAMLAFLMCAACLLVPAKGEKAPCRGNIRKLYSEN